VTPIHPWIQQATSIHKVTAFWPFFHEGERAQLFIDAAEWHGRPARADDVPLKLNWKTGIKPFDAPMHGRDARATGTH
jgi:hypothetical protein